MPLTVNETPEYDAMTAAVITAGTRFALIVTALLLGPTVNTLLLLVVPFTVTEANAYAKPPITCGLENFTEHAALVFQFRLADVV